MWSSLYTLLFIKIEMSECIQLKTPNSQETDILFYTSIYCNVGLTPCNGKSEDFF